MNRTMVFALCASLIFSTAAAIAAPETAALSDGVIRKLDRKSGTVTITHGELPSLNMGPMTMSFTAQTPAMLKSLKEGDKIRFRAVDAKGVLTVTHIEAAK